MSGVPCGGVVGLSSEEARPLPQWGTYLASASSRRRASAKYAMSRGISAPP